MVASWGTVEFPYENPGLPVNDARKPDRKQCGVQSKRQRTIQRRELTGDPAEGGDQHDQRYIDHRTDARPLPGFH
jgi:hypothetical protein